MSLSWKYLAKHFQGEFTFMSPWAEKGGVADLTLQTFYQDFNKNPVFPTMLGEEPSMKPHFQIAGTLPESARVDFGNYVPAEDEEEIKKDKSNPRFPVLTYPIKASGEEVLFVRNRLEQFIPFITMVAAFEKAHNPNYIGSSAVMYVKQWDFKVGDIPKNIFWHVDPNKQITRNAMSRFRGYIVSDCAPTMIYGEDKNIVKPWDILCMDGECWHSQAELDYDNTNDGKRTMAQISFHHREFSVA